MAIISVSLTDKMLHDIDAVQHELGFSGRSEVIRAGARLLIEESRSEERLHGTISSILILLHEKKAEDAITAVKHEFEDIINTQIHNHTMENKCLDIFILNGDAERIRQLSTTFQTSGKVDYLKLVVP
ncbi:CopG family ribbon-helix-helix protein [archaeon]|nr:MAG: CopG family ribbon-helix-helix protein [archaeon]